MSDFSKRHAAMSRTLEKDWEALFSLPNKSVFQAFFFRKLLEFLSKLFGR